MFGISPPLYLDRPVRSLRQHYYQPETLVKVLDDINKVEKGTTDTSGVSKLQLDTAAAEKSAEQKTLQHFPPRVLVKAPQDGAQFSTEEIVAWAKAGEALLVWNI